MLVRKSDGQIETLKRNKLRTSMLKAAVKRCSDADLDDMVQRVIEVIASNEFENPIDSHLIGTSVLRELQDHDPVWHVRFSLVFEGRQDLKGKRSASFATPDDFLGWLESQYPNMDRSRYRPPRELPVVIKKDGRRVPFAKSKLERSLGLTTKGRGLDDAEVAEKARQLAGTIVDTFKNQALVTTGQIAAETLKQLLEQDPIAFLRAASSSKEYQSVEDYASEAEKLRTFYAERAPKHEDR